MWVIAQRGIYDALVDKLSAIAKALPVGDPLAPETVVGPVITKVHRERVEGYVASGVEAGATAVAGGTRPDRPGCFVAPTLLAGATNQMRVAREEIFGPVVVAIPFDDEEEGIAIANDSDYGLHAYVFSGDVAHGMRSRSGCARATSASTRRTATWRRRSAASSTAASVATGARSPWRPTPSGRAWCGRAERRLMAAGAAADVPVGAPVDGCSTAPPRPTPTTAPATPRRSSTSSASGPVWVPGPVWWRSARAGQATLELAARGASVLALEPGPALAAVLRSARPRPPG